MYIEESERFGEISSRIIKWYRANKRDLPWRNTRDPYLIWISEVILQQTRVNQGYDYFMRFTNRFADVNSLANASEEEVLKIWQGLGYYSRARNLHAAAKDIMIRFNGIFPNDYKSIISLKGIGEYTAAAIVSIAYDLPYAVVDGNVFRVLSRIFAIDAPIDTGEGRKVFNLLAQELMDKGDPATFNQAIMEMGALQCISVNPDCSKCPVNSFCLAYGGHNVKKYPFKKGKTKTRNRYFNYFEIRNGTYTYIIKRTGKDIWRNLYEFPLIETFHDLPIDELLKNEDFLKWFGNIDNIYVTHTWRTKHVLSHQIIYANFYRIDIKNPLWNIDDFIKTDKEHLMHYPVSRLVNKYMEKFIFKDLL